MNETPSLSQTSRRALAVLRGAETNGAELMGALGLTQVKDLEAALSPLVTNDIIHYAGDPFSAAGLTNTLYYVPPGGKGIADLLLTTQPVKLSEEVSAEAPLSRDACLALKVLRMKAYSGEDLLQAIDAKDAAQLSQALSPLVERGLVRYEGQPFSPHGLRAAWYSIPEQKKPEVRVLLQMNPVKFAAPKA